MRPDSGRKQVRDLARANGFRVALEQLRRDGLHLANEEDPDQVPRSTRLEVGFPDPAKARGAEGTRVDEADEPAVAVLRIGLVLPRADRSEDPISAGVPLLDLVVVTFDVGPEELQVGAQPLA